MIKISSRFGENVQKYFVNYSATSPRRYPLFTRSRASALLNATCVSSILMKVTSPPTLLYFYGGVSLDAGRASFINNVKSWGIFNAVLFLFFFFFFSSFFPLHRLSFLSFFFFFFFFCEILTPSTWLTDTTRSVAKEDEQKRNTTWRSIQHNVFHGRCICKHLNTRRARQISCTFGNFCFTVITRRHCVWPNFGPIWNCTL